MAIVKHLRLAVRRLLAHPGFASIAVLTLALGIGANAAIFSVVHAVLLKPLPFESPERIYGLWHTGHGIGIPQIEQSNTTYTLYREHSRSFAAIGLFNDFFLTLTGDGEPARIEAAAATASLFEVLGVEAQLGRVFTEEEDDPGAPDVAILSHALWQGRFGADPSVVGRVIRLNATSWTVIGVMPRGFNFPGENTKVWIPHVIAPEDLGRANFSYDAVGRLDAGVSAEAATAELRRLLPQMPEIYPGEITKGLLESAEMAPYLTPLIEDVVGHVSTTLWILLGTVGFVLLIACANVANLFLARAEGRLRELAIRSALGAKSSDVWLFFLSESLVLSALGGLAGLGLAWVGVRALVLAAPDRLPRAAEIGIDPQVLAFTTAVAVVSGVLFGLVPALRYHRINPARGINDGSLRVSPGRDSHFARNALVVVQVALALTLLIGSGLMLRSFRALGRVQPGFDPEHLMTVRLSLPRADYPGDEDPSRFYQRLFEDIASLPGVVSVGGISNLPMTDGQSNNGVVLEDFPVADDELPPIARVNYATPGYFETLRIPLLAGRTFEERDYLERTGAAVVSASFVETHLPGGDAVGRRIVPGLPGADTRWYTIVGVVGDVRDDGLAQSAPPMVYYPVLGFGGANDDWVIRTMSVAVRTSTEPSSLAPSLRERIWALDPNLPLVGMRTGGEILAASTASTSFAMVLLGIAATMALALGAVGIYGVISYVVSLRTREIGIRMALGAGRRDVDGMVVGQGVRTALVGVAIGVVLSLGTSRLLSTLLFGVQPNDPLTFVTLPTLLLLVAGVASLVPARRASRVDPVRVLSIE